MVETSYANAYTEVLEILKYITKESYQKIPASKIEMFNKNSNKEYHFEFNPSKKLDEQNVSKIAKTIIGILFRDYILNRGTKRNNNFMASRTEKKTRI